MSYELLPLPLDAATLTGLSATLIQSHHANNYGGAVKRLNAIQQQLGTVDFDQAPGFLLNGLKREELIAYNSMLLHEIYFDSLGGDGLLPNGSLRNAIERDFGSVERWQSEFVAMGKALGGGSGWVLLVKSPRDGKLCNQWASDHCHTLAGGMPVLALDMYEHAYHIDFGAKAAGYVDAFMKNIDWSRVEKRWSTSAS
ncbi:superoxide dismutase [Herminiimonas fonticola]|uniref:superoxide dismutase n=1 Tax=Herminiimonas fonticola TaxID=303380 RepID=A0A4R6G5G4_9BURK|nr:Fe-Mn family superoxide dismutase [Herminiimonas fonticola]RBA23660.1 Superoxide dismutase [Herminiimonas fonticola]TDN89662.1 Fe-Mn family superoxide dismutase [Herminiimonas fonticola]